MTSYRLYGDAGERSIDGGNSWGVVIGCGDGFTEDEKEHKIYSAYTFSDLRTECIEVPNSGDVIFRDDGVSQTVLTVSFSATGWGEDIVGSDTPAANSFLTLMTDDTGMHGSSFECQSGMMTYDLATDIPLFGGSPELSTGSGASSIHWPPNSGDFQSENIVNLHLKRATTLSNLQCQQLAGGVWEWCVRKNDSCSTNVTVDITGVGFFEDTTGSESFAADDTFNFGGIQCTGTWQLTNWGCVSDTSSDWWGTQQNFFTTREYMPFDCDVEGVTTADDNFFARIGNVTAENLQGFIGIAGSGTRDVSLRINSSDSSNLTVSWTVTGLIEDTTGSEAITDGDSVQTSSASSGDSVSVNWIGIEIIQPDVAVLAYGFWF